MDLPDYTAANRKAWDASSSFHNEGEAWEALRENFKAKEFSTLDTTVTAHLNDIDVADKSVVQIGCNNGREILSICSLGARECLGIDISGEFIDAANRLNESARRDCEFLQADIFALPDDTRRDFDLVFITIGVLGWMPDIQRFMNVVASLLKPGGSLLIYETHPFLEVFDPFLENPYLPVTSYFRKEPFVEEEPIVYDGSKHERVTPSYWFVHTLGEVVTACATSGFRTDKLIEYPHSNREVDYAVYENQDAQLPMCFALQATREA